MNELSSVDIDRVCGGVSGETWGCAIGGAMGSYGGPWGSAAGCIAGAAAFNYFGGLSGVGVGSNGGSPWAAVYYLNLR